MSTSGNSTLSSDTDNENMIRQDSSEKRKAKDMKAKPSPLLIQHIESEEQSVSPHYRVMDSPPTPESKVIKREFSESTSVSPSSSPDTDLYMFPSPVTPPDSDSSPPKPQSPSSAGTDFDEEGFRQFSCHVIDDAEMDSQLLISLTESFSPCSEMKTRSEKSNGNESAVSLVPTRITSTVGVGGDISTPTLLHTQNPVGEHMSDAGSNTEGDEAITVRDKIRAFELVSSN